MRPDMAKQIVERERAGSGNGEDTSRHERRTARHRLRNGDEDFEVVRGIKAHVKGGKRHRKSFNENLNPLRRFLLKNIGRPWDKVYSEICEHIKLNSTVQRHILEHLEMDVDTNVRIINGKPYKFSGFKYALDSNIDGWVPLTTYRGSLFPDLYVDPCNGLLKKAPIDNSPRWRDVEREEMAKNRYYPKDDLLTQYHRIDSIWYEVKFREPTKDELAKKDWGHWEKAPTYGYVTPDEPFNLHGYPRKPKAEEERPLTWRSCRVPAALKPENFMNHNDRMSRGYSYGWTVFSDYTKAFGRVMLPLSKRQLSTKEVRRVEEMVAKTLKSERIRRAA